MPKRRISAVPLARTNGGTLPLSETGTGLALKGKAISGVPFPSHRPSGDGRASGASARPRDEGTHHHAEPSRLGSLTAALVGMLASARADGGDIPMVAQPGGLDLYHLTHGEPCRGSSFRIPTKRLENGTHPTPPSQTGGGCQPGWGGARNQRGRTSDELTLPQAKNIIEAARHATAIGLAFSHFITIHWALAGIPDSQAAAATGAYLTRLRDNVRKRGGRAAWAWVRENGDGKGSHLHVLAHVPSGVPLGRMHRRWLKQITGKPYVRGTILTERIGGTLASAQAGTDSYLVNLGEVVAYLVKGVSPATGAALRLDKLEPGGRIIGKRCGTSENVGAAARRRRN